MKVLHEGLCMGEVVLFDVGKQQIDGGQGCESIVGMVFQETK